MAARNQKAEERHRRYQIDPRELLAMEETLDPTQEWLVGFYHSHPDHPARPSEYDQDHAWPWYTYIVASVHQGRCVDLQAWELRPDRAKFLSQGIEEM